MSGKLSAIIDKANELETLGLLFPDFPDTMLSAHEQSFPRMVLFLDRWNILESSVNPFSHHEMVSLNYDYFLLFRIFWFL